MSTVVRKIVLQHRTGRNAHYEVHVNDLGGGQFQVKTLWGAIGAKLQSKVIATATARSSAMSAASEAARKKVDGGYTEVSDQAVPSTRGAPTASATAAARATSAKSAVKPSVLNTLVIVKAEIDVGI